MILRSITLENFGLYSGRSTVDVSPRKRRGELCPVVLIGGKNGVGKTTLLEAVRLALYGRLALGSRIGQSQYDEYLRSRIHRPLPEGHTPNSAAVGIEFDFADQGRVKHYRVRRSWSARGRSVAETLLIEQDGTILPGVQKEEWQDFLHDLIPVGVSQLFFFDGEKIAEIADGDHDEEHLASAIRSLLGIDLVSRLRNDLGLYLARQLRGSGDEGSNPLEEIGRDTELLDEQIRSIREDLAQLSTQRESATREAERLRQRFVAEGGELALRRNQIVFEMEDVSKSITRRHNELRDQANRLLPFTIAPRLTRSYQRALNEAKQLGDTKRRPEIATVLRDAIRQWRSENVPSRTADWKSAHWKDVRLFLEAWASQPKGRSIKAKQDDARSHSQFLPILDEAESTIRPRLEALSNELDRLYERQRELQTLLLRADSGESSVLLEEMRLADQRLGAVQASFANREAELKRLSFAATTLGRKRDAILLEQAETTSTERSIGLAQKASRALAVYERRLLEAKLAQLQREFVRCFNRLARKQEVVSDVRIDTDSFTVTLIDKEGRESPKAALSAGEKQIYAIAILWALARTSGRALPVIIDTPLARLDSDHRANLLDRYFPHASHQVVMLSTDTEVDASLFEALRPSVSRAYRLEYDTRSGSTVLESGYFWPSRVSESAQELESAL